MQAYYIEFILAIFAILMLLAEAFVLPKGSKSLLALAGIIAILTCQVLLNVTVSLPDPTVAVESNWMSRFYAHSKEALIFKNIALFSTLLVLILSWDFRSVLNRFTSGDSSDENTGEFYSLPIFTCAGMMWMASAIDFVSIFVALELVTISFYIMVAYMKRNVGSLEAGVKYLILGALSTGILVYGIAWLYGAYGTTEISKIADLAAQQEALSIPALFGLTMIIISLAFKVGAVPMQLWIPDVYQGSPTPVTAFLSVASKAAGFAISITILAPFVRFEQIQNLLLTLAAATLLYGNLAALKQENFKRLLAYSSIAHAGFMMIALAYGKSDIVIFYLITYMIMTFAAFFILNGIRISEESDELSAFDGLAKRNPNMAISMAIIMSAMAGLPLTVGFFGKFFVIQSIFSNPSGPSILLLGIVFLSVASGFYYYLKVVKSMFWHTPKVEDAVKFSSTTRIIVLALTILILIFGVYPAPITKLFTF